MLKYNTRHILFYFLRAIFKFCKSPPRGFFKVSKVFKQLIFKERYFLVPLPRFDIYVCPTHLIGNEIIIKKEFEPEISEIIKDFVSQGFDFVDVGANIGYHTLVAASSRTNKTQKVIAFEPQRDIFRALEDSCLKNNFTNIHCFNEALGENQELRSINISSTRNKGRTSFITIQNSEKSNYKVPINSIDDKLMKDFIIENKNYLIKIDVEGFELSVLKGAVNWLNKIQKIVMIIEICPPYINLMGWEINDIYKILLTAGFDKFYRILNNEGAFEDNHLILKNVNDAKKIDNYQIKKYQPNLSFKN